MARKFILDETGEVKEVFDVVEWAKWFETAGEKKQVAYDKIGDIAVSTVFLGYDHSYTEDKLEIYETMVFGGDSDGDVYRYATKEEALIGHKKNIDNLSKV